MPPASNKPRFQSVTGRNVAPRGRNTRSNSQPRGGLASAGHRCATSSARCAVGAAWCEGSRSDRDQAHACRSSNPVAASRDAGSAPGSRARSGRPLRIDHSPVAATPVELGRASSRACAQARIKSYRAGAVPLRRSRGEPPDRPISLEPPARTRRDAFRDVPSCNGRCVVPADTPPPPPLNRDGPRSGGDSEHGPSSGLG